MSKNVSLQTYGNLCPGSTLLPPEARYLRPRPPPEAMTEGPGRAKLPLVRLQRQDFRIGQALDRVRRPDCGALLAYLGTVRETAHGGRRGKVVRLEYEAFQEMATAKLAAVRKGALRRFDIKELLLHHRIGRFDVGTNVVLLAIAAPHRDEALLAARWAIGEMKQTVPIWKKEVYRSGGARWVVGEMRVKEVASRPKPNRPKG
jgi:molybdopterin synthase catalytic subunit